MRGSRVCTRSKLSKVKIWIHRPTLRVFGIIRSSLIRIGHAMLSVTFGEEALPVSCLVCRGLSGWNSWGKLGHAEAHPEGLVGGEEKVHR